MCPWRDCIWILGMKKDTKKRKDGKISFYFLFSPRCRGVYCSECRWQQATHAWACQAAEKHVNFGRPHSLYVFNWALNLPKIKYPRTRTQIPTLLKTKAITVLKTFLNLCQCEAPAFSLCPDLGLLLLLSDLRETTSCSSSRRRSADLKKCICKLASYYLFEWINLNWTEVKLKEN